MAAGLDVDRFAPRLSFFWAIGMNFFMEVAKMRAARLLWAKLLTQFNPKDPRSLSLRTHCQTSGWSLTAQDVFNNVMRTTIEAMAATQGHTQSLHTNALDEALALPTDFSARIARNTQLFLQQESGTNRIIDPWGGSYYVERLTRDLAAKAWGHIQEVEALGGMAKAIEAGVPKLRIEEASAKTQARIDAGRQAVIGVNKFKPVNEAAIDVLKVENSTVRRLQIDKLKRLRTERDQKEVDEALAALTRSAGEGNGNLLALAIDAARAKATVGEISDAMEKVFGRHRAEIKSITGVYKREASAMSNRVEKVQELIDAFETAEGRRPRILVAKIGQDGHDRGQKVIASAFADVGFDVDIGPLFATADEAARQAVENDVHILGVSSLAAAHLTAVPELKAALKKHGREDIMIIIGGVVPPQDYDALYKAGAEAIFPPGTVISDAAEELIHKLNARLGHSRGGGVVLRQPQPEDFPCILPRCQRSPSPGLGFVGAIACASALGPLFAAEPKPDFPIKTKSFEASVYSRRQDQGRSGAGGELSGRGQEVDGEEPRRCRQGTQAGPELFRNGPWTFERKYDFALGGRRPLCQHRQGRL